MESIHVERLGMSDDDLNAWITSVNQQLRLIFVFQGVVFKHVGMIGNINLQIVMMSFHFPTVYYSNDRTSKSDITGLKTSPRFNM